MRQFNKILNNEKGMTLIEIVAAMLILGIALAGLATMTSQNFIAIDQNKLKEEAAFVRDDIKEWLNYRAQTQDIANLNPLALKNEKSISGLLTDKELAERYKHLILDESGVQVDPQTGKNKYGEVLRNKSDTGRGKFISKVEYDLSGSFLPNGLKKNEFNKYNIGKYIGTKTENDAFLVEVKATATTGGTDDSDVRKRGLELTILIYSQDTGALLTETQMRWVPEY